MNYRGSYRHLLGNAKAAMLAAIEVYNKPCFQYRDECFVILLLNAWELALKALLSKNKKSIFYPKKRGEPYRTLSWRDGLSRAEKHFPKRINSLAVRKNLDLLGTYRDNAVHFYNAKGFGTVVYSLAQTSIVNFKDLVQDSFGLDLSEEISWQLLPLALNPPVDPIQYISQGGGPQRGTNPAVSQFISEIAAATEEVEAASGDTGRLMTFFAVKLESTKKIEKADVVVGIQKADSSSGPLAIVKTQDPNISHPLRQTDVLKEVGTLHGRKFTSYVFQAVAWKHDIKSNPTYCWEATEGVLVRYARDIIPWIKKLSPQSLETAVNDYRQDMRERRKRSKK
ncbi:DUF3644 domain-containing protein [Planctomycetota bacterium]